MDNEDNKKNARTSRRDALKLGLFGALSTIPIPAVAAKVAEAHSHTHSSGKSKSEESVKYTWLKPDEAAFLEAATERLIPADEKWGGAKAANVTNYIDKQLGGRWGAGERLYRSGPWHPGTPQQGYQLPFTPAEFMRNALGAINKELAEKKTPFSKMSAGDQDAYLHDLEKSDRDLDGIPAKTFFATLLKSTMEGFFADPVYGGNKDMMSWKMIGFPGAGASYLELVDKHGIKVTRDPISLAEDSMGHMHMDPNISSQSPKVVK